jgi:hypothetical protein
MVVVECIQLTSAIAQPTNSTIINNLPCRFWVLSQQIKALGYEHAQSQRPDQRYGGVALSDHSVAAD